MKTGNLYGILIRYPQPGEVKTRLAREIGKEAAAREYRAMAEGMLKNTAPPDRYFERIVFFSPADMEQRFSAWLPAERLLPQRGNDIGEIMRNVLEDLFQAGAARAVITGSDIPGLEREILLRAFDSLDRADIVIGPAADGGYYLIGMKALHEEVFQDISWGTGSVFAETVSAISKAALTYETVTWLSDVDTLEDLKRSGLAEPGFRRL